MFSDKPSSPSKPIVTEITSSSVIVKWNAPASDGNSAITAYTVECKETGVSHWQAPVPFVSTTSTVVDDLTPGSVYQFRVSANNVVGISKPSPPTDPITLDVGNGECLFLCSCLLLPGELKAMLRDTISLQLANGIVDLMRVI